MPWDPVLKLFLLKKVLAGLVNSTRDPQNHSSLSLKLSLAIFHSQSSPWAPSKVESPKAFANTGGSEDQQHHHKQWSKPDPWTIIDPFRVDMVRSSLSLFAATNTPPKLPWQQRFGMGFGLIWFFNGFSVGFCFRLILCWICDELLDLFELISCSSSLFLSLFFFFFFFFI